MEKMTLHRALSELKLIDAKIEKAINEIIPTGTKQEGKLVNQVMSEEDFTKLAQSRFDSVTDLIERKSAIKSAIVEANSKTHLTIAGKSMSISDAITAKATIIPKKKFIEILKARHNNVIGVMNKNNEVVARNMQAILEAALGKDNVKTNSTDVDSIRIPYMRANEFHLFDPLKIGEKIEKLETEVSQFETEVDAALSEINAITFIGDNASDIKQIEEKNDELLTW